jgi:hypothetical protein
MSSLISPAVCDATDAGVPARAPTDRPLLSLNDYTIAGLYDNSEKIENVGLTVNKTVY